EPLPRRRLHPPRAQRLDGGRRLLRSARRGRGPAGAPAARPRVPGAARRDHGAPAPQRAAAPVPERGLTMALTLADRWVLVTGASSGLGHALAVELATRHRACLVLSARRRDRLESLARELDP